MRAVLGPVTTVPERQPESRRWVFITLLSTATFINYLDRGSLSVALPFISRDLHLSPLEQGLALSSFFWIYTAVQIPVGWLVDRYDIRAVYAAAFCLWSLSAATTGLAQGLGTLLACRIVLGLGESVYLPGGMKVVGQHFTPGESAWPTGLFDLGAKVGLAFGTTIDVWLLVRFGWRSLFFRTGLVGLLWIAPWLLWYPRSPAPTEPPHTIDWRRVLTSRALWAICLGFFCWDYFWYFLVSWLPTYLYDVRHVTLVHVAVVGAMPFLIFAASEGFGSWASGALIRRGWDMSLATKGFIALGFGLGLFVVPAALVGSASMSIAFFFAASMAGFACGNLLAIPRMLAPEGEVALWTGVQNFVGNIGGILAPLVTGALIQWTGSYVISFFIVGVCLLVGIVAYVFMVPSLLTRAEA